MPAKLIEATTPSRKTVIGTRSSIGIALSLSCVIKLIKKAVKQFKDHIPTASGESNVIKVLTQLHFWMKLREPSMHGASCVAPMNLLFDCSNNLLSDRMARGLWGWMVGRIFRAPCLP